jgi:GH18 family chitinase
VIIGYVFAQDRVLDPAAIAAEKLTHINYAFANHQGRPGGGGLRERRRELPRAHDSARATRT